MTDAPCAEQFIAALLQGLAKPVGGDAEGTVSLAEDEDGEARGDRQAPQVAAELVAMH